jgi:hypothetical protein
MSYYAKQSQFTFYSRERCVRRDEDICVSDCPIKKYAFYHISPRSLRTRRLMKNKPKQSQFQTLPCKNGASRVSIVEVVSLECTIGHYGEVFAG